MSEVSDARRVVELAAAPGVLGAYRAALLQRPHGQDRVPEKVLRLTGVQPQVEHLRSYLDVCGGRLGDGLPLLYPHLLGFGLQLALLTDRQAPFAALGLVHVANSVTATAPLPLGAPLDVEVEMGLPQPHRRGRTIDLLARVALAGEVVWRSSSTYLKRERTDDAAPSTEPADQAQPADDLLARPGAVCRLPADLGRQYAEVSGDRNPIHLSALSARPFGFRTAIAHGMWTAARSLTALEGRVPAAVRYDVEFRAPIALPGSVEFVDDAAVGAREVRVVVRGTHARGGAPRVHLIGSLTRL